MEASFPDAALQPAAKRAKTCNDVNGIQVERLLKCTSMYQLLSFLLCPNAPGCETEFFACCKSDT